MDTITRIIAKFWSFLISIFGNAAERSKKREATDFHRTILVSFELAGHPHQCFIVPHRDKSGTFHCAIVSSGNSSSLTPRTLRQVAEYIAHDYFHKEPERIPWVYIPLRSGTVVPENVVGFQFERLSDKGDMRVTWSAAAPEVARTWIDRTAMTREFGQRIRVR